MDFVECFHSDTALSILALLDDPVDLVRASVVSHSWRRLVISNGLCKQLCLRKARQTLNICDIVEGPLTATGISGYTLSFELLEKDHKMYVDFFEVFSKSQNSPKLKRHALARSYWRARRDYYDPTVTESIIFKLDAGVCFVTQINISPNRVSWGPLYHERLDKVVQFKMGYPRSISDLEVSAESLPFQQLAEEKFVWTYTSEDFPISKIACMQQFKLPEPVLCIGGYLQIELLGWNLEEVVGGHYVCCLHDAEIKGHTLKAALDIDAAVFSFLNINDRHD